MAEKIDLFSSSPIVGIVTRALEKELSPEDREEFALRAIAEGGAELCVTVGGVEIKFLEELHRSLEEWARRQEERLKDMATEMLLRDVGDLYNAVKDSKFSIKKHLKQLQDSDNV